MDKFQVQNLFLQVLCQNRKAAQISFCSSQIDQAGGCYRRWGMVVVLGKHWTQPSAQGCKGTARRGGEVAMESPALCQGKRNEVT